MTRTEFDPEAFGFVKLRDFQIPGGVDVFEYRNHAAVDGKADVLRLNIYLTRDGAFVTIWCGLLEPTMTEGLFELPGAPDLDFNALYCEPLFRGYIERNADAAVILKAVRVEGRHHSVPQVLAGAPHDLRCELLP